MAPQVVQYAVVMAYLVYMVSCLEPWREKLLRTENEKRALHGAPPLKYSDWLEPGTQKWADQLASECGSLHHTPKDPVAHPDFYKDGNHAGENLFHIDIDNGFGVEAYFDDNNAAEEWYSEITDYNFETDSKKRGHPGHFTQLVWKDSQEVAYSRSICDDGHKSHWYVVARYFPRGNIKGRYHENVLPPRH